MRLRCQKTMDLLLGTLLLRPYVFAFLALFLAAGLADLGLRRTLGFVAWVWPLAWLSEFASTRVGVPFGLYRYTESTRGQELFVADVPMMDSLSFTFLAYAAFALARAALRGRAVSLVTVAAVAGGLMMLLDVVIDPLAVRGDRWFLGRIFYYLEPGPYFGVPWSNFAGWWLVGTAGVGGYLAVAGRAGAPNAPLWPGVALYYAVLGFNLAVTVWIGEWFLFAVGLALHVVLASVLVGTAVRAPALAASGKMGEASEGMNP
jgi:putative membrane protein